MSLSSAYSDSCPFIPCIICRSKFRRRFVEQHKKLTSCLHLSSKRFEGSRAIRPCRNRQQCPKHTPAKSKSYRTCLLPVTAARTHILPRQNNDLLSSLASKATQLRHVTVDIYDNARSQSTLDNTNEVFSNMSTNIRGSAGRLTRMARSGDRIAVLKLAGIIIAVVLVVWFVGGWIWGLIFGK